MNTELVNFKVPLNSYSELIRVLDLVLLTYVLKTVNELCSNIEYTSRLEIYLGKSFFVFFLWFFFCQYYYGCTGKTKEFLFLNLGIFFLKFILVDLRASLAGKIENFFLSSTVGQIFDILKVTNSDMYDIMYHHDLNRNYSCYSTN